MSSIAQSLEKIRNRVTVLERRYERSPGAVRVLAVSKTKPPEAVRAAAEIGQREFGENHVQDALTKLDALADMDLVWHFIGPIQSNKTRVVAARFHWVHSIDRAKIARRLNEQRPDGLPPLEVCIQVNLSGETSKSGVEPQQVEELAQVVSELPRLRLRGLMTLPQPCDELDDQRRPFAALRGLLETLNAGGLALDTLSMGMTNDMEAAIAEGATIIRIGTAIFGPREVA
ncbi:MAG: YggS family pyridoxal phosphate-dependent enzyme [Gammaproteobacteria bacterium]|jgi:pyridoxal phosphate enzyme (YggS family)|nr:YggS family pyridoxal phosphate-dependent enzyme [Gammaproteobacteria bacterium]NCF83819.1 YggS family pyridoxal phosphate-dependent enzyme [Pseudomonadota bacterium]